MHDLTSLIKQSHPMIPKFLRFISKNPSYRVYDKRLLRQVREAGRGIHEADRVAVPEVPEAALPELLTKGGPCLQEASLP